MTTRPQVRGPIVQNAYVVDDLERACHRLHAIHGLGPFFRLDAAFVGHRYFGEPAEDVGLRVAFAQSGELNIELIQQTTDNASALRLAFPHHHEGLHHVARFAADYAAERDELVELGYPVVSECNATADGTQVCFVDTREALGHMIELYEEHPALRGVYAYVRETSQGWDGTQLISDFPV